VALPGTRFCIITLPLLSTFERIPSSDQAASAESAAAIGERARFPNETVQKSIVS
jgi:hypothetical protein